MLVSGSVNDLDRPHCAMANETSEETVEIRRDRKIVDAVRDIGAARTAVDKTLKAPGRTEGVRKIAKRFGVDPGTVQRISRPFDGVGEAA